MGVEKGFFLFFCNLSSPKQPFLSFCHFQTSSPLPSSTSTPHASQCTPQPLPLPLPPSPRKLPNNPPSKPHHNLPLLLSDPPRVFQHRLQPTILLPSRQRHPSVFLALARRSLRTHHRFAKFNEVVVARHSDVEPELADAGAFRQAEGEVAGVAEARVGGLQGGGVEDGFEVEGGDGVVVRAG
jgi:hypothetical protein